MAIKVLIVDDSALMRQLLTDVLQHDPRFQVCDTACDPIMAREKIKLHNPDVLTLDVEMPRMDGLSFLTRLMTLRPMPVVMISSLTREGADVSLRALEIGAVDCVAKPDGEGGEGLQHFAETVREKVAAAAQARIVNTQKVNCVRETGLRSARDVVMAIGASTGGVPAVSAILEALPRDMPPIVITQHMPPGFTRRFAERINASCRIEIAEAIDGAVLRQGVAYIAPGGLQTRVERGRKLSVRAEGRISGHCPSVDVLFSSLAQIEAEKSVGVILTGMGSDGARGLLAIRQAGGDTIGQDEATSLIYGMPRVAAEMGAVMQQMPLQRIAQALVRLAGAASTRPASALI